MHHLTAKSPSPAKEKVNLVWLKRDLRIQDHRPLAFASEECQKGIPAIALYCFESDYWNSDKASPRQRKIVWDSLHIMAQDFEEACPGGRIFMAECRSADEVIARILEQYDVQRILTHQETHNLWTFERDIRVQKIAKAHKVEILEAFQNGVNRAWTPRNWSDLWKEWVTAPLVETPKHWVGPKNEVEVMQKCGVNPVDTSTTIITNHPSDIPHATLLSFLNKRCLTGRGYRAEMSGGELAAIACSRISQHLTWGGISTKEAYHIAKTYGDHCTDRHKHPHMNSFITRLLWRDNFIQQFESHHSMELYCMNPAMEHARGSDTESLQRFVQGQTGYPFVDACMRRLNETGWITFRARAMLVSFAAYALNLDWRAFGPHLAQNFIDYEPGIHYCQLQMQSGTTLRAPTRIYNPLKQSVEHDPKGDFIRLWIPELKSISGVGIHTPENRIRNGYPTAIVNPARLWKTMRANGPQSPKKTTPQLEFFFEEGAA
jgi:deoxyribodipyrimidine photo-lyase